MVTIVQVTKMIEHREESKSAELCVSDTRTRTRRRRRGETIQEIERDAASQLRDAIRFRKEVHETHRNRTGILESNIRTTGAHVRERNLVTV